MSLETLLSANLAANGKVSAGSLAYLAERARANCYDYVMRRFDKSGLSQADLARRIGKDPAQINRLLASPGNWTIGTIAELLAVIAEEEFIPSSLSLTGRAARNFTQADFLAREGLADRVDRGELGKINIDWINLPKNDRSPLSKRWDLVGAGAE